jgi:hypothetical protein
VKQMTTLPFFDRQSPEAQYTMYRMAQTHTAEEIIDAMKSHNVVATESNVAYYRHINGINTRYKRMIPADNFVDRIGQYIEAIAIHGGDSWSNRSLMIKGAIWARCATNLCAAGMIAQVAGTRPMRYERLVGMDVIGNWYLEQVIG